MANSLSAMPLGRLVPASHFCTVDSLVCFAARGSSPRSPIYVPVYRNTKPQL
jgi:hypothetical protein